MLLNGRLNPPLDPLHRHLQHPTCILAEIVQDPKNTALYHEWRSAAGREARNLPQPSHPHAPSLPLSMPPLFSSPTLPLVLSQKKYLAKPDKKYKSPTCQSLKLLKYPMIGLWPSLFDTITCSGMKAERIPGTKNLKQE